MPTIAHASQNKGAHKPFKRFQVVQIVGAVYPKNEGIYGYVESNGPIYTEYYDEPAYIVIAFREDGTCAKLIVEPFRLRAAL